MPDFLNLNNANCNKKIIVPEGFRELLQDLAVEVLRNQPRDILTFSINYLTERRNLQENNRRSVSEEDTKKAAGGKKMFPISSPNKENSAVVMKIGVLSPEKIVAESGLFANINPKLLANLKNFVVKNLEIGEELKFSKESESPIIYFVQSGKLELMSDKKRVAELSNNGYFGDTKESLTVIAKTPSKLIALNRSDIDKAALESIEKRRQEYIEFINDMILFEKMSEYGKRIIIDCMIEKTFKPDEIIFSEGEQGKEMFLIYEGLVSIQVEGKEINSIGEGNYFGELAVLENEPRVASVVSVSNSKVLSISINTVKTFIEPMCRVYLDRQIKTYFVTNGDDEEDEDSVMVTPQFEKVNLPRKSVSAGKFNPEMEDDDDDEDMFEGINTEDLIKTEEQRVRLRQCCKSILLFRCLDDEQLEVVIDAMFQKVAKPGDVIIKRGDDGDNFYVVDNGIFDIIVPVNDVDTVVAQYKNEGSFGELALMYNTPRSATVIAKTDGLLWAMNREMFRKIVLKKAFQKRLMYENLLAQVPLFKNISVYERTNVADALRSRVYEAGANIIKQGEEGHEMYFIEEGKVEIYVDYNDGLEPEMLGDLERGKYFGEMALINQKPRAASITAKTKCKIAVLDRESFERLLGPCIDVMKRSMEGYEKFTSRKSMASTK